MTDLDSGAELHTLIGRTMADVDVPVARLHDTALRRGRATRRRRRVGAALGGVAAVAAVTAVVLPALTGTGPRPGDVATDGGTSEPGLYHPPTGWWDMPGTAMGDRLAGMLPAGLTVTSVDDGSGDSAPGEDPHGWVWATVADDGAAAGALNVILYPPAPGDPSVRQRLSCPGNLEQPDSCTEIHDDGGDLVGRTSRWTSGGVVVVEATRLTRAGAVVYAAASNSSDAKWGPESSTDRRRPPVAIADLREIVEDPSWQDWNSQG